MGEPAGVIPLRLSPNPSPFSPQPGIEGPAKTRHAGRSQSGKLRDRTTARVEQQDPPSRILQRPFLSKWNSPRVGEKKRPREILPGRGRHRARRLASSSEIPPPGNRTQRWPPLSNSDKDRLPDNPIVEAQIIRFHQLTEFSPNRQASPDLPLSQGQHLTEPDNLRRVLRREKPPGPRKPQGRTPNAEALCYRP